jgi:hypothetical protein
MFLDFYRKFLFWLPFYRLIMQRRREQRKKNQDRKSKPTMPKSRENQQRGNPFCTHPIATAPPVCYNNQAPKGAKEGVFNAEQ